VASAHRKFTPARLIGIGLVVVLLIAMVFSTKFLTPEQLAAALPKPFDAKQTAEELFAKAQSELPTKAQPLGEVVTAIQTDIKAAATKYKAVSPGENTYVFAVEGTGTVTQATANSLRLEVPGVPPQTPILVPLGTSINGTVIRDAMGFKFADAPGQTQFQYVGDELKKLMQQAVSDVGDPSALEGKKVTVVGAITQLDTGAPVPKAKPVNVQPVSLEVGS
jgi:predicted lipoprotein